jgi:peptidoglycan-associated lipoprotein
MSMKGLVLCALCSACAAPAPPTQGAREPKLPDPGPDREYKVEFPALRPGASRFIRLTLDEDLSRECGLVKAHFKFDSAEPLPQDQLELRSLAECIERPAFADVGLLLVGRADRRGDPAYNEKLGLLRAERVKQILIDAGVPADRIYPASRGASGAVGDDKLYSYGYDRRVDVQLLGVARAPR